MNSPALPAASRFQNDLDDNLHQNTTTKEIRENKKITARSSGEGE